MYIGSKKSGVWSHSHGSSTSWWQMGVWLNKVGKGEARIKTDIRKIEEYILHSPVGDSGTYLIVMVQPILRKNKEDVDMPSKRRKDIRNEATFKKRSWKFGFRPPRHALWDDARSPPFITFGWCDDHDSFADPRLLRYQRGSFSGLPVQYSTHLDTSRHISHYIIMWSGIKANLENIC